MPKQAQIGFVEQFYKYLRLARLDKPVGFLLLLWPTLWGLWMAENGFPEIGRLSIFILGVFIMRSAGCIINDIIDKGFDKDVTRTSERVLVTGEVSVTEAYFIVAGLLAVAASLLVSLNEYAVNIAFIAAFSVIIYPFFKRFFPVPQAVLGIAFGFGILMAYADTKESIDPIAWTMFLGNFFWAISYDTAYAMVDKEDDLKIGLKSSAITFGKLDIAAVCVCQFIFLILMIAPISLMSFGFIYGIFWFFAAIYSFYLGLSLVENPKEGSFSFFQKSHRVGAILFFGMLLDLFINL
ncbi:MAG: 4-hydroxybenzoate polyprenyltransferase [Betaproteobacteria bacterium TMED41]|nr:MAG: 4-hydroxybenzoate polyprenyltransferase [Betaproteobacteria bacterium TMED41]